MSDEEFRKEFGLKCPHCRSDMVNEAAFRKADGLTATATVVCGKCGKSWTAVYTLLLTGYIAKDGHGNVIEHAGEGLGIEEAREVAADKAWDEAPDKLFCKAEDIEPEGWSYVTGEDRRVRNFYYGDHADGNSRKATFIVVFKPRTAKVLERYINW